MPKVTTTYDLDDEELAILRQPRDDLVLERVDGDDRFACASGPFERYQRSLDVHRTDDGRFRAVEHVEWRYALPLWRPLFDLATRLMLRAQARPGALRRMVSVDNPPWWSPPARLDRRAADVLGRMCVLSMLAGYLGTIITQTMTYSAAEFGASSGAQGNTLAAVRVGVLFSLAVMVLADRHGRRRFILFTTVAGASLTALGALAPNLVALGASQTIARSCSTALALLLGIVAAEEMPAGARAYAASVLTMSAALGAGGAVLLLPICDLAESAWRVIYVVPLLALPAFYLVGRRLPESKRFVRHHARKASMVGHRGRLALLATTGFLGLLFASPISQFQNDFLRTEHDFGAATISLFTVLTTTPGAIGIIVGGRLADMRGRRIVGAVGTGVGAVLLTAAFFADGPALWGLSTVGTIIAATTVPALAVYGPELFPTALRAKANGILSVTGVTGSAVGLVLVGRARDHFDAYGPGVALAAIGPLIMVLLVLALYPETANVELEDLNPEDAPPDLAPVQGLPPI